jgi:hypothetical protein
VSEFKDIDLEQVGKVDEHVVAGFLLSAGDVETDGDDVHALAALGKLVLDGEGVEPRRSETDDFGEP